MKKQSIVLGSIFVVGLLLIVPNISAVEYQTVDTDWSEDELRDAILERIEELQEKQTYPTIEGLSWDDPDGPLEGGLDDYSDYINVLTGILSCGLLLWCFKDGILRNAESLMQLVAGIVTYGGNTFDVYASFGEAFDVWEYPPGDGR